MITGTVKGQALRISSPTIAADTISYLTARFVFTSDWDGAVKFAHFSCGEKNYSVPLTDNEIREGDKLNLGAGTWKVWLHGERYEGGELTQRITTEEALLVVRATGSFEGGPFPTAPSEIERLHAEFDKVKRGVQADWGQNDETAADFVRNRPCYTEWKAGTYFDVTLDKAIGTQGDISFYEININEINWDMLDKTENVLFVDGREYNIVFDGVAYTLKANNGGGIGNVHLYNEEIEDNGMPFALFTHNGVTLFCKTAGAHSIKVTGEVPTYHKLDKRYYNSAIEYDKGVMEEGPSMMSIRAYNSGYERGIVYWNYSLGRPTEEEVKELGDDLFKLYPINLYVQGAANMILGEIPYGDSPLIIEFPINVGDIKDISIPKRLPQEISSYDTNQYLIKMMEKSEANGAKKQTFNVWFNNYETRYGVKYSLLYYNNALYSMELRFNLANLKIKRIL